MGKARFVNSRDTIRLALSDGDWIEVRRRLTNAEQLRLVSAMDTRVPVDRTQPMGVDAGRFAAERLSVWLRSWSFTDDDDGRVVPVTLASIAALDPDTATEIQDAITEHERAQRAMRETAENAIDGAMRLLRQTRQTPGHEGEDTDHAEI